LDITSTTTETGFHPNSRPFFDNSVCCWFYQVLSGKSAASLVGWRFCWSNPNSPTTTRGSTPWWNDFYHLPPFWLSLHNSTSPTTPFFMMPRIAPYRPKACCGVSNLKNLPFLFFRYRTSHCFEFPSWVTICVGKIPNRLAKSITFLDDIHMSRVCRNIPFLGGMGWHGSKMWHLTNGMVVKWQPHLWSQHHIFPQMPASPHKIPWLIREMTMLIALKSQLLHDKRYSNSAAWIPNVWLQSSVSCLKLIYIHPYIYIYIYLFI
jgi:hypothetical protein